MHEKLCLGKGKMHEVDNGADLSGQAFSWKERSPCQADSDCYRADLRAAITEVRPEEILAVGHFLQLWPGPSKLLYILLRFIAPGTEMICWNTM